MRCSICGQESTTTHECRDRARPTTTVPLSQEYNALRHAPRQPDYGPRALVQTRCAHCGGPWYNAPSASSASESGHVCELPQPDYAAFGKACAEILRDQNRYRYAGRWVVAVNMMDTAARAHNIPLEKTDG